ncbi:GNAT family N-acetyltransferase [Pseudomonas syringae]|nr:GNAT family N-acetyltransferase [Pseudomonas syringae]
MLNLDWLSNHMHHSDTMALWLHRQFDYEFASQSLADWQLDFSQGQANGHWKCLIAMEDGELLGGASLASDDLAERPDLGPWLACVLVKPEVRGRGVAGHLIDGICSHARAVGISTLYLHTHDQHRFYAKRGWRVFGRIESWGKEHYLMSQDL